MSPAIPDKEHPEDEVDPVRDDVPRPGAADPSHREATDPSHGEATGPSHGGATGPGASPAASPVPPVPSVPPAPVSAGAAAGPGDPAGTTTRSDDSAGAAVGPDSREVVGPDAPVAVGAAGELPGPTSDGYFLAYEHPVPARPRAPWRTLAVAVGTVLVIVLLGVPLGLAWRAVAPSVPVIQADGGAVLAQPQPEEFVAADGWFSLFGLVFGLLAAIVVWVVLRRYRGPAGMVLVALGSIGAAVVAWQVGRQIGLDQYHRMLETAAAGTSFGKPPDLRAGRFEWLFGFVPALRGDLLMPAFGAVVMYTMLAGWSRYAGLGAEPEPIGVSWDSAALPAPPPAPAPPAPDAAEPPRD
ncbi:DUF2567 domain-containing protein [Micromonospora sp. NPDC050397]|uniref:DUF2567 domain-containing protein n=1 Tax=Micromonospora sp. NPDC050397 TaxID=3364279 RepID=UPI00384A8BED